jgi:hypothetical protein
MQKPTRRAVAAGGFALVLTISAYAQMAPQQGQQQQTVRVRGTVEALQGQTLVIKARDGAREGEYDR